MIFFLQIDAKARNTFLEAIESGSEIRRYVRIQVIGKDGVGKSSLVRRLLGGDFDTEIKSTDGIDIIKRCQIRTDNGEWVVSQSEFFNIYNQINLPRIF